MVYGKSGIGKSSLLRAGVFPQLRQNGLVPIYLRLAHNTEVPYTQQVENAIAENVTLKDLLRESKIPDMGLWDFLHRHQFVDGNDCPVTPVIVLDQFEEIFTLTQVEQKSDVQAFFTELADVLNDVKPDRVIEAEATYNKQAAQPQTTASQSGFVLQSLSRATLKYEKSPSFRIVFSLRDDSLYLLERSCAKIPALKVNRYNLRALDESSALDVIMKPCPDLFSDKEAREILDGLAYYEYDDYRVVDPAILSLFLYTYYQEQGKVSYSDIFGRYYKECTKDIKESSVAYIEDHLLTERGNRNQIPFDDIIAAGVAEGELELLLERKILKTEKRKGHDYAEFSHDRLCDQALEHREERKKSEQNRSFILRLLTMGMICILIIGIVVSFLRINYLHHDLQNTLETKLKYTQTINQNQSSLYQFLLRFFAQHHNYAYSADKLGGFIERAASNQGGQTSDNSLITQTGRVKVGQSYKYTFASKGHQELAVLAELGGLITLRIHITNRAGLDSIYCDEQEDIKRGRPQRIVFFDLPADRRNNLELEVINCGQSDCNFVIISN